VEGAAHQLTREAEGESEEYLDDHVRGGGRRVGEVGGDGEGSVVKAGVGGVQYQEGSDSGERGVSRERCHS